jgi:sec-independent protein translocase protein TatB
MLDMGWWEFGIVGLMVILVLGPKELPHAMRAVARFMRKARRLASEFQDHMNDLIREADLDEINQTVRSIKNQDVGAMISNAVDPAGEITKEIESIEADARREVNEIKSATGASAGASISNSTAPAESKLDEAPKDKEPSKSENAPLKSEPAKETPAATGNA